mgnify:CR=1 FL=1
MKRLIEDAKINRIDELDFANDQTLFNKCLNHLPLKAVGDNSQELYALFPKSSPEFRELIYDLKQGLGVLEKRTAQQLIILNREKRGQLSKQHIV